MRLPRLFIDAPLAIGLHALPESRAHYLGRVLRRSAGDAVQLFDGSGSEYLGTLRQQGRQLWVEVGQSLPALAEAPLAIHLGQGLSRGERMDFVVQKATELGVAEITPILSQRTQMQLKGERSEKRLAHWRQIAISACEQCGRSKLPRLHPPKPLNDWLQSVAAELKLVLQPDARPLAGGQKPASLALLIGAEGGLSAAELKQAQASGFQPLRLGPRILRTETAALAALAVAQQRWGDFSGDF